MTKGNDRRPWGRVSVFFALLSLAKVPVASAQDVTKLVFFGDSLPDPGNYFVAFGTIAKPPFVPIPDAPYAIGGHHCGNGATSAEQLASDSNALASDQSSPTSGSTSCPKSSDPNEFQTRSHALDARFQCVDTGVVQFFPGRG
jgi:hypothetical protein